MNIDEITSKLVDDVKRLKFEKPVAYVYNPLGYAREPWDIYVKRFGKAPREIILLGMNPGPFGMAQTGVPFGDVASVRDWLGISGDVGKPPEEHPKRPVQGFGCRRREVSGMRLWGWARKRFGTPENFFGRFFVANYCPLVFMEKSGRNFTPDKLPRSERRALFDACDLGLKSLVSYFDAKLVIGVGVFAFARAKESLAGMPVRVGRIPHPSPASPAANNGWEKLMEGELAKLGVKL